MGFLFRCSIDQLEDSKGARASPASLPPLPTPTHEFIASSGRRRRCARLLGVGAQGERVERGCNGGEKPRERFCVVIRDLLAVVFCLSSLILFLPFFSLAHLSLPSIKSSWLPFSAPTSSAPPPALALAQPWHPELQAQPLPSISSRS